MIWECGVRVESGAMRFGMCEGTGLVCALSFTHKKWEAREGSEQESDEIRQHLTEVSVASEGKLSAESGH